MIVNIFCYNFFLFAVACSALAHNPKDIIVEANKKASYQPESKQFLNAGMIFDWEPNRIYQIYTKPGRITDIALEPGEKLSNIAGGDTQRWTISESQSGADDSLTKHIFVKPQQDDLASNLVLTTDRRVYHIELHSKPDVPYQAAVSWNFPRPLLLTSRSIESAKEKKISTPLSGLLNQQLNFKYHFVATSKPKWMPRRVFDDGHKTYIEFPSSMQDAEAPALWGLTNAKESEVINYRRYQNFYIIDHLIDLAELLVDAQSDIKVGIEREGEP
jgi:P-type conjugative transfer protein TrbG